MKKELEQKLMDRFPWFEARNVWTDKKLGFPTPCSCGDGWYQLIHNCLEEIENLYKGKNANINTLRINQIKEKYGGLRIYVGNFINGVDDIIDKYEDKSYEICEFCGELGELKVNGGWYRTVCNKHAEQYGYRKGRK